MKQILFKAFTFLALVCVLGVSSCRRCTDESCQNGGVCESGKCICPYGWYGYSCELNQSNSISYSNIVFHTTTAISSTCGSYRIQIASFGQQYISSPNTAATCGTPGSATFASVPYGSYTYNVFCNNTNSLLTTGTVTVSSSCVKRIVNP